MAGTLQFAAKHWMRKVNAAPRTHLAVETYGGRSFAEARRVASHLDARLHIVSAGLTVVDSTEAVPQYGLTVVDGANSIRPLLARLGKKSHDWWDAMLLEFGQERSVHALIERNPDATVLIALPSSYLSMIADDLSCLSTDDIDRVRVFSSARGRLNVCEQIQRITLPYDDRLEGSDLPGTRNDFAQRALRHFIENLQGQNLTLLDAHAAVASAMSKLQLRKKVIRERKTDLEISILLRDNWVRFEGSSTRLLRFLRDDSFVACEQKRFRNLWLSVRNNLIRGAHI
ncbi:hypothetical protein [Paraburkholderia sp. BL27I4N3]|uniref:hypothetical protein n=1 Tax=Paraburkholderia sp. BL27I4N3 TaxID=1938805 RepID=UPI0015F26B65|nr:hypothetical protein [Paraburkholderia sp. BL27I4N3]